MSVSAVQDSKTAASVLVTEFGIVMLLRFEQCPKVWYLSVVTKFGITILVSELQYSNAASEIEVTELGIVRLFKLVQCEKAPYPIV